ncbi:MAG: hypothetical protein EOO17_02475 [Chloroflexi bacterium]|nr:MAG: hypothetical protein EOO17_02475 [Chloroflexota bacterium]
MSHRFDQVIIIYNPNSTGDGKANAMQLRDQLRVDAPKIPVTLRETSHAGHAEEMARQYAKSSKQLLLISSSGDGGYHEMINGILLNNATNITAGILPSGNANDHYTAISGSDITTNIIDGNVRNIDAIKITSTVGGKQWTRYAHSYAGIGLTPTIGRQLTKADLNWFNERWLLVKYLFKYTHATITVKGQKKRFSSLVWSNIAQMSKVVKLAQSGKVDDGKFEISSIGYRSKLQVIALLIKSATFGLEELGSFESYTFKTIKPLLIQLDGEIYTLDARSDVNVESVRRGIHTVL